MFWDLLFFPSFIGFWWFLNMLTMCWDLLGQSMRLFRCTFNFWSFWVTAISLFWSYRDPCRFSCVYQVFRGNLSISAVHFVVWGFRCLFSVRKLVGLAMRLFAVFSICCFSSIHRVLVIRQYAQNKLRFTKPIPETFRCDYQLLVILNNCYFVVLVILWSLLFFMPFIEF